MPGMPGVERPLRSILSGRSTPGGDLRVRIGDRSPGAARLLMTREPSRCHHDKRRIWRVSWLITRCRRTCRWSLPTTSARTPDRS